MLLCSSFSHINVWISGTRCISLVFSSSTTTLVSTNPSRTAPITLAATGILSFFLCLIHSITDLKTNVSDGALRSSRLRRFNNWSASIRDKNSHFQIPDCTTTPSYVAHLPLGLSDRANQQMHQGGDTSGCQCNLECTSCPRITTMSNNSWHLEMAGSCENFEHVFLVNEELSTVNGVHYDLKPPCWNVFIFELNHFLVWFLHSVSEHCMEIVAISSENIAVCRKDGLIYLQTNVHEFSVFSELA